MNKIAAQISEVLEDDSKLFKIEKGGIANRILKHYFGKNLESYESVDKNKKKIQFNLDKYNNSVCLKINHLDGSVVEPQDADFSKTEGYRLPTELEWQWFANRI